MAQTHPLPSGGNAGESFARVVAAEVRAWRARLGVTQTDLARTLGLSQAAVSARLNGHTPFTLDEVAVIADLFGIDIGELLGFGPGTQSGPPPGVRAAGRWRLPRLDSNQQPAGCSDPTISAGLIGTLVPYRRGEEWLPSRRAA